MGGGLSRDDTASGDVEMQQNPRGGGGGDDDEDINTFVRRLYLVIGVSGVITIIAVVKNSFSLSFFYRFISFFIVLYVVAFNFHVYCFLIIL